MSNVVSASVEEGKKVNKRYSRCDRRESKNEKRIKMNRIIRKCVKTGGCRYIDRYRCGV